MFNFDSFFVIYKYYIVWYTPVMIELWQNKVWTVFISSHVQWLKKADEASYYPPTAFDFDGQIFTVLKSGQLEEGPWDLYSSPLV